MREATSPTTQDQRRLERYPVTEVIEVIDVFAERPLGRLLDISRGGMMLSSERPIPLNQIYQVALSAQGPLAEQVPITLGLESLWNRESADGRQVWTGFQLISVSEQDRIWLERMLGAL